MSEIDTDKLIKAVKARQGLYNKNDTLYYSHKKYKTKMWTDVCREVYSNWDQLRPQDKVEYAHELQKRWKSLRTCFTRELALQKKEKMKRDANEGPFKRRKRYEYFSQLTFLLNPEAIEEAEVPAESDDEGSDPLEGHIKAESFEYHDPGDSRNNVDTNDSIPLQQTLYERNNTVEEKILDMLRDIKRDEVDEDRQFMLSLVPSFKKLNDKQKFEARIEMLKVLKNISFQEQ
ncbi:uncharacterized protein LOC113516036 [Galleria mellonella]|uniref:Uncharacterized protein LOC113516036 n=1 Tax=Galleria mellonella TaxID=7137 RepID=A0A6J1WMI7_GALME|nr:uncharacterized protein LOC113516036 [Galleria mellonella]